MRDTAHADFNFLTFGDETEKHRRREFLDLLRNCPIPGDEMLMNMGLFLTPQTLSRILFMDFLYRHILDVQGIVVEFGCRWGQNISLFSALRGIYEPFNRLRKVVGFDTFAGFPRTSDKDGTGRMMTNGSYSVTPNYEQYLNDIMACQEHESPLTHLKKYELVKGDGAISIHEYLSRNPETIIALAYFDFDLYAPTKECLLAIKDRLTRHSVIAFDELNDHECPGETLALKEVFGLNRYPIRRFPSSARTSYLVLDDR
ncbi:MAG: crotonobetainyl-CoA--carnitine CoA-transferase [Candidatus Methylomirabilia bacterium]